LRNAACGVPDAQIGIGLREEVERWGSVIKAADIRLQE